VVVRSAPPRPPLSSDARALWRRWTVVTAGGELVGFLIPALTAVLAGEVLNGAARLPLMVLAGAGEGAVLGTAQCRVLRLVLPEFSTRDWTARTAAAAALAWAFGMLPSSIGGVADLTPIVQVLLLAPAGVVLLASIGTAQWTVLRRHVPGASAWIGWTALGWLAGLAVFFTVATPLWRPGQPAALVVAVGVLAALVMAATMAAVTGWGLVRLLHRPAGPR
jgi:hypothetical protein